MDLKRYDDVADTDRVLKHPPQFRRAFQTFHFGKATPSPRGGPVSLVTLIPGKNEESEVSNARVNSGFRITLCPNAGRVTTSTTQPQPVVYRAIVHPIPG